MSNLTMDYGITLPADFLSGISYGEYSKDSSFEYEECETEAMKERSLWQSVIVQAVLDAMSAPINSKARREKTKAIIWFSLQNKDFLHVCEMAGMDPIRIISGTKLAIKQSSANNRRKLHMKRLRNANKKSTYSTHNSSTKILHYNSI